MKLGDLFSTASGLLFKVTGIELRDNDPWVLYENTQTLESYSCRQEAFLSRFFALVA
jgi:hypothetical protein